MRRIIDPIPMYTMWLRQMKRWVRAKSRIASAIAMPLLFLVFMGLPMGSAFASFQLPGMPKGITYLDFLAPGIIGMILLTAGLGTGLSVLWDKEFGFLREVMVAPVLRSSIMVGRSLGGMTTTLIQAFLMIGISVLLGVKISSATGFLLSIIFMILICTTFIGLGLTIASLLQDTEGFSGIMSLIIMPIFFLSGAFFPVIGMPRWLQALMYIDPLTYGVDGLRGTLIGYSQLSLWLDFSILLILSIGIVTLGTYFFNKMEVS